MDMKSTCLMIIIATMGSIVMTASLGSSILAQQGQTFSATISGDKENPPTKSNATAVAQFQTNNDNSQLSYWINATGLKKITASHIHRGNEGENGPVVVVLSKGKSADKNLELNLKGNITRSDLTGPLKGKDLSELANLLNNGSAYVNLHTAKYPKGAIRGQISSSSAAGGSINMNAATNQGSAIF
jgi:hypothetical protein